MAIIRAAAAILPVPRAGQAVMAQGLGYQRRPRWPWINAWRRR